MMRSPSMWAVAVRKPDGQIAQVVKEISSPMARSRIFRLPVDPRRDRARRVARDRLPGARDLGELRGAGSGREGRRRRDGDRARPDHLLVRDRDRVRADALQGDAGADHELCCRSTPRVLRRDRGRDPRLASSSLYLLPDLAPARPPARLPVPRRRAQGDQRLRGGRGAHAGERAEIQFDPPALRNGVFALGDGDRDLRLRVRRPAGAGTG